MTAGGRAALALALALAPATANAEPLWSAELRAGLGLSAGGGQGMTTSQLSPLVLEGRVSVAVNDVPRVHGFGGLVLETLDRSAVGATAGVQLRPAASAMRISAGGVALVAPYSLWGALVGAGRCFAIGERRGVCGDVQVTAYMAGSDLAPGHNVVQAQLVLGVSFDGP